MKLLGRFYIVVANEYRALLDKEDIEVRIETPASYSRFSLVDSTLVNVFVPEEAYDKAVGIIKDFEMKNEMQLKEDSKEADRVMLNIFIVVILVVVLFFMFKLRALGV